MFDHIVVPLDGSKLSEAVLSYVVSLARHLRSKIVLLHAESHPYADMFDGERAAEIYRAQATEGTSPSSSDYLGSISERIRKDGVQCETFIDYGSPAAVILNYIRDHSPHLLAMSTHGFSGIRRMVVGSVTTTVLPRARIPVLVVHPIEEGELSPNTFESLVIPLDMSERCEDVLPSAAQLAGALGLNMTMITCLPSPAQLYTGSVPDVYPYPDNLVQQTQDAADEYLSNICTAFNEEHDLHAKSDALEGSPASQIVEYAAAQPNSLIAMCTQGRTGLGRWVLGSVTDTVIRTGNIPVLVVPHAEDAD